MVFLMMEETAQGEQSPVLSTLFQTHELQVACSTCYKQDDDVVSSATHAGHLCAQNVLLARKIGSTGKWRCISARPKFPNPGRYVKCEYLLEGQGCTLYGKRCTFAKSEEEAYVWNFLKSRNIGHDALIRLLIKETKGPPEPGVWDEGDELSAAERICRHFPGLFANLCHDCFHSSPQQINPERPEKFCHHPPNPTLVLFQISKQNNKVTPNEIRPAPQGQNIRQYRHCRHVAEGGTCFYGLLRCSFAHSEVELAVWTAESNESLDRKDLLLSHEEQGTRTLNDLHRHFYCSLCLLQFSSQDGFVSHCSSLTHERRYCEETAAKWKHRCPPENPSQALELCKRPDTCEYGDNCTAAHSVEELQEWCLRKRMVHRKRKAALEQGLMSYRDLMLMEYRDSLNEVLIMSEDVEGVTVSCDKDLNFSSEEKHLQVKWTFTIQSERPLMAAALLKQEPGATFTLGESNAREPCVHSPGSQYRSQGASYILPVSFDSTHPGHYEQWLVLDFDTRPVLLRKLRVGVGVKCSISERKREMHKSGSPTPVTPPRMERWHGGNRIIVRYQKRAVKADEELLKDYKPPQLNLTFNPAAETDLPLTRKNYRERMHTFLYREELAQEEALSRLNLQGAVISLSNTINVSQFKTITQSQTLYASVPLTNALMPHTPEGQLLRGAVRIALLAPSPSANNKVYEALVLHDVTNEDGIYLQLSRACCSDLGLEKDMTCHMDIHFQLHRLQLCEWHQAVDLLPDVERVLPPLTQGHVPKYRGKFANLNTKQEAAMALILGEVSEAESTAPLLIYGPFGTGKTFTLATAVKELLRQPGTRVLICTRTNSSADLYVKHHFHQYVESGHQEARPLRIKANKKNRLGKSATDDVTLRYCLLSDDCESFILPKRSDMDSHRVVITTTMMARHLHDLKLPAGYFTHILIDEASQMLECEALIPLGLAGMKTRVVLAGDHMQMGPKLFSVAEGSSSEHTLLNRLFYYYQAQNSEVASKSRIILNENYRCTKEIVDFVSTHFYTGKTDVIKAIGGVPSHPRFYPLRFHHVRGSCQWDKASMSWFNVEEAAIVVEIVEELLKEWPSKWGKKDQEDICVLSEGWQVKFIRRELRNRKLGKVIVENMNNVQGKQFRAIVMSAVHTRDSLLSSDTRYPDLFADMRVLNTAMTRAQSQVVAIGDAPALCCFGKCSKIWQSYINQCIDQGSANPQQLSINQIEQEVKEISKFSETEEDYSGNGMSPESGINEEDPILQELLDESKDVQVIITEEGLLEMIHKALSDDPAEIRRHLAEHRPDLCDPHIETLLQTNPNKFKRCELNMEKYDSGYAMPLDQPTLHIAINGRENFGKSFPGDLVAVEILSGDNSTLEGKVVGVLKRERQSSMFVCAIDKYDPQIMTPINKCVSKIFTPFVKGKQNFVAVRKEENGRWITQRDFEINEYSRQNLLFVVQVLKWVERCRYPLGVITKVLNTTASEDGGLEVLDIEYHLKRDPPKYTNKDLKVDTKNREDFRSYPTFTIDPPKSHDLDDAISVRDLGKHYEIGVHITDVASIVSKGSEIDEHAEKQGIVYSQPGGNLANLFSSELRANFLSLLPDSEHKAISLLVEAEKESDRITKRSFFLSLIKSERRMTYEEADKIIQSNYEINQGLLKFDTLEDCLAVSYHFSKVHKQHRTSGNWRHVEADEGICQGKGMSHNMIEELMIMYNSFVSDFLITNEKTGSLTPLRCQDSPDPKEVCQFMTRHSALIPFSVHLSHLQEENVDLDSDNGEGQPADGQSLNSGQNQVNREVSGNAQQQSGPQMFYVFTSLFKKLKTAAQNKDFHTLVYLITNDDFHPQLQPVAAEFSSLLRKSYTCCSMSTLHSKVGHYNLQLDSYTRASSPMHRYMDIIVQRLLHSVLEKNTPSVKYTSKEIDLFCARFQKKCEKKAKFDTHVQILKTVNHLSRQSTQMMAIVNRLDPVGHNFQVSIPLNQVSMSQTLSIMYRHLKLIDQPKYDEKSQSMSLKWKCRVYSFTNTQIHSECLGAQMNMHVTPVQTDTWQHIVSALRAEDWETVLQCVQSIKSSMDGKRELREESFNVQHHTEISLDLKVGRSLPVQLGTDTMRGQTFPAVQLVNINPQFEICVQHSKDPIKCFSEPPLQGSKKAYTSYKEYKDIWGKLCAVETAYNAVAENDSIIFEDVKIKWHRQSAKQTLQGNFRLSLKQKQQWSIECDLKNCFLCVRLRDQTIDMQEDLHLSEIFPPWDLEEPQSFTWVAHGVTTKTSNATESKRLSYVQIDFILHHFSMENIPKSVFSENVKFTVELIPKKLPYVLNEHAIANLTRANYLVKSIVMGNKTLGTISENSREKFESEDGHLPGFSPLNDSQKDAIKRALERPFTLIQGPPGTGKTVVGIHIVYWFFMKNKEAEATIPNTQDMKQPFKKNAILYCGPSNKSVDIVAEQVLKLKGVRPLRVYSDQIEMLEFPYPGSHLKVCRKSLREEKPNEALRKITLRYLIRKSDNPYADKITSFEKIIQTEKEVDDDGIAGYKKLLNEARQHELRKHDVILCTCSSASDPNFLKTMNFRQILIDECAMATEPEALIPLVAHSPEQIVLLGDHKQIRPIVECELMKKLGMKTSLFERYMEDAVMLDTQYRMHEGICKFPSWKFYKDSLKTEGEHELSALCSPSNKQTPILFGHVEGREVGLLVSTEKGNENSTANVEEAEEVVRVASLLISNAGIEPKSIAILTPYNAQVSKVNELLSKRKVKDVTVCTIMKSQGSEWRYVILSTVRSCPISDINKELPRPTKAWLSKRLGFVIDPNLVNVGITRAQDGLCIIGNKNLLRCNELWRELLEHYEKLNCVVDPAKGIQVLNPKHKQEAKQKK